MNLRSGCAGSYGSWCEWISMAIYTTYVLWNTFLSKYCNKRIQQGCRHKEGNGNQSLEPELTCSAKFGFTQLRPNGCGFCIKSLSNISTIHYDVIKWKHFPRNWSFVRRIHRSPVNSPHKGQWRRALMFPLICIWINDWVNNREAGDLRRHLDHYDVSVMIAPYRNPKHELNVST